MKMDTEQRPINAAQIDGISRIARIPGVAAIIAGRPVEAMTEGEACVIFFAASGIDGGKPPKK
jgi:hypothetical protein